MSNPWQRTGIQLVINDIVRSGYLGFFKVDCEKNYFMVNREFLLKMLAARCFSRKSTRLFKSLLDNGSIGGRINNADSG
jgi:hypothetical protein